MDSEDNHRWAARKLCDKMGWGNPDKLQPGYFGGDVFWVWPKL